MVVVAVSVILRRTGSCFRDEHFVVSKAGSGALPLGRTCTSVELGGKHPTPRAIATLVTSRDTSRYESCYRVPDPRPDSTVCRPSSSSGPNRWHSSHTRSTATNYCSRESPPVARARRLQRCTIPCGRRYNIHRGGRDNTVRPQAAPKRHSVQHRPREPSPQGPNQSPARSERIFQSP